MQRTLIFDSQARELRLVLECGTCAGADDPRHFPALTELAGDRRWIVAAIQERAEQAEPSLQDGRRAGDTTLGQLDGRQRGARHSRSAHA
jgi:hypothetical protein